MRKRHTTLDREIRIELLRAQAAIERGELCSHMRSLSDGLRPGNLFNLVSGMGHGSSFSRWGNLLMSSTSRYPMLISVLSAVVGGVGGKGIKAGALGLLVWRVAKTLISRSARQRRNAERNKRLIGPL